MAILEVLRTGPLAIVEDLGRTGLAHLGVGRSGAADRRSHTLANRLVANPDDRATVEVTFGGFSARVRGGDVDIAVTGPTPIRLSTESCSAPTAFTTSTMVR
ncbi:allophanate hydrolase subunit 2 family protein [Mycobacterium kansasii 824]|uniref:Allophanate hydrolase subunit 2 family protein n=1 Tax=Mycobacterium kansasii TaxID=1768 RepID=A0A1V3WQ11_MYCKA|nr:allophanate hydrolase subunit 2 family protein [Mycobacterium kansasii 824]OOK69057.1 allophanate hydrolase subunit 2 family protein [Mycobacterium kansasii]